MIKVSWSFFFVSVVIIRNGWWLCSTNQFQCWNGIIFLFFLVFCCCCFAEIIIVMRMWKDPLPVIDPRIWIEYVNTHKNDYWQNICKWRKTRRNRPGIQFGYLFFSAAVCVCVFIDANKQTNKQIPIENGWTKNRCKESILKKIQAKKRRKWSESRKRKSTNGKLL